MTARSRGFSILELAFAIALLSVIMLGLASVVSTSQRTTSFTRERSLAMNAIRTYVESMRGKSTAAVLADTSTPADFLPAASSLRDARGTVTKICYESGLQGSRVSGARGAANTPATVVFTAGQSLGFTSGGRDLDGDKVNTSNPVTGTLLVLPAEVSISWTSAVGGTQSLVVYAYFTP